MFLTAAVALFVVFALNVVAGALGRTPFLGDVGEMLLLFAASVAFVVAVLRREAAERKDSEGNVQRRNGNGHRNETGMDAGT